MEVEAQINQLKEAAAKQNLEIKFRNRKMPTGDFCIFIYDRSFRKHSYAVGFDGSWGAKEKSPTSFNSCLKAAYHWLEKRDYRYHLVNGVWTSKIETLK